MIILTKEETALLLAIKGHNLEILPKAKLEHKSSYVNRVAALSPGLAIHESDVCFWILRLFDKLFDKRDYISILEEHFGLTNSFNNGHIKYIILSKIYCRKVDDLELDKSITIIKE